MTSRLLGLIIASHELLHIVGFRLIGKPYHYRWGEPFVQPAAPLTRWEQLVVALFPVAVTFPLFVGFTVLVGLTLSRQPGWDLFFLGLTAVAGLAASFCLDDLGRAYRLVTGRDKTPFDSLIQLNEQVMRPRRRLVHIWVMLIICLILLALQLQHP
jgi:hypothetical protein